VLHQAGADRLVPRADLASYDEELAGLWAYEALRVAARRPRLGVDTDHRTIPNEVGWLDRAVHLDKGCYRGQETVARVYNLGRPPRRLVLLHLDGSESELPTAGDAVTAEGREVGRVGTAVRHYELGPLALALVKRQVADDAVLIAGTTAARIDPAPDDEPVSPARAAAAARTLLPRRR
jgi:folate-binding protein YgfZ